MYRKYFDSKNHSGIRYQLLVPASLRKRVLKETHDGLCGRHLGKEKTLQKLKLAHYWPGYWNSVRDWCRTCVAGASSKTPVPKNKAPLQSIVVGSPVQMVHPWASSPDPVWKQVRTCGRGLFHQMDRSLCNPESRGHYYCTETTR